MKIRPSHFESIDKEELHDLCDRLLTGDAAAIDESIAFLEAETRGIWHGRARAMIARRLKHCRLSQPQCARVVRAILNRFLSGRFSEQFKDQLRLVLQLAPERAFTVAHTGKSAAAEHVRRYAAWILSHETGNRRDE